MAGTPFLYWQLPNSQRGTDYFDPNLTVSSCRKALFRRERRAKQITLAESSVIQSNTGNDISREYSQME
jgi:hypothetical protein